MLQFHFTIENNFMTYDLLPCRKKPFPKGGLFCFHTKELASRGSNSFHFKVDAIEKKAKLRITFPKCPPIYL